MKGRSKIFNKLNKNKEIKAKSGGIIVGKYPLDAREIRAAKNLGIVLKGKPAPVTTEKLIWQDILVIVADNVPKQIFDFNQKKFKKKTIVWKIPDIVNGESERTIENIIKMIMKNVEKLVKEFNFSKSKHI